MKKQFSVTHEGFTINGRADQTENDKLDPESIELHRGSGDLLESLYRDEKNNGYWDFVDGIRETLDASKLFNDEVFSVQSTWLINSKENRYYKSPANIVGLFWFLERKTNFKNKHNNCIDVCLWVMYYCKQEEEHNTYFEGDGKDGKSKFIRSSPDTRQEW